MNKKTSLKLCAALLVTIVGTVSANYISQQYLSDDTASPSTNSQKHTFDANSMHEPAVFDSYSEAVIQLDGVNNTLMLKVSRSGYEYRGGAFNGTNISNTAFIPLGQKVSLSVAGTNNEVLVESRLLDQVRVHNIGTNNRIEEL